MTHYDISTVVIGNQMCDPGGLNGVTEKSPVCED